MLAFMFVQVFKVIYENQQYQQQEQQQQQQ